MEKSKKALRQKKTKAIKVKDRALTLFNIANLALMANTGTVGLIKAVGNLGMGNQAALPLLQVGTEMSTLLVTSVFVYLAIAANKLGKSKKHDELMVKAHELEQHDRIDRQQKEAIWRTSKTISHIDTSLTVITTLLASIFLLSGMIGLMQKANGFVANAALFDIIGYGAYIFAVLLTLLNKVMGDKLQSRIEKDYLGVKEGLQPLSNKIVSRLASFTYQLFTTYYKSTKGERKLPLAQQSPDK